MCGRFYADAKTAEEIVKIAGKTAQPALGSSGDIFPSGMAAILLGKEHRLRAARMLWGFPGFHGKGLIINARAETVLERRMFRDSVEHRRCVIPAKGFYEWNRDREKYFYEKEDEPVLWMAVVKALAPALGAGPAAQDERPAGRAEHRLKAHGGRTPFAARRPRPPQ